MCSLYPIALLKLCGRRIYEQKSNPQSTGRYLATRPACVVLLYHMINQHIVVIKVRLAFPTIRVPVTLNIVLLETEPGGKIFPARSAYPVRIRGVLVLLQGTVVRETAFTAVAVGHLHLRGVVKR